MNTNRKNHWETIYKTKLPNEVSWTQEKPETSLDFIQETHLGKSAKIIDIGGGDSKLVDFLLDESFENITVLDISEKAIEKAREINKQLNLNTTFICCDIYDLPNHLNEKFDIVFTSYGTIGWLPDLNKWAKVVSHFLKPDGKFVMADFHPVVWMFDNDFREVFYNYFNTEEIIEDVFENDVKLDYCVTPNRVYEF